MNELPTFSTLDLIITARLWADRLREDLAQLDAESAQAVTDAMKRGARLVACVVVDGDEPTAELCLADRDSKLHPVATARRNAADGVPH